MPIYEAECKACHLKYEWLDLVSDDTKPCPRCGGAGEKLYSLYSPKIFKTFTTRNIMPDGSPVTITTQGQLSSLLNEHGLAHLDDPGLQIEPKSRSARDVLNDLHIAPQREEAGGPARKEDLL